MSAKTLNWMKNLDLDNTQDVIELLFELGHFIPSGYGTSSQEKEEIIRKCSEPGQNVFRDAVASLQDFMSVKTDGIFGPKSKENFIRERRCACPDIQMAGQTPKWSVYDLRVWHDMSNLGGHNSVDAYKEALEMWASLPGSPFTFKWIDDSNNRPNFFGHDRNIDGRNKILAWHEMLGRDGVRNSQLEFRVDNAEAWAQLWLLIATLAHEIGHGLGLYHINEPEALMYPSMNGTRKPMQPDIAAIMDLYAGIWGNGPTPDPDPPKPKPPIPGEVEALGEFGNFTHQGYIYRLLQTRERV